MCDIRGTLIATRLQSDSLQASPVDWFTGRWVLSGRATTDVSNLGLDIGTSELVT